MRYFQFKKKMNKIFNKFLSENCFWAFSEEQLVEGLQKFGYATNDNLSNIFVRITGGGFMLKSVTKDYDKLSKKRYRILKKYLSNYKHLIDALCYEMCNHECAYTGNFIPALNALSFTTNDLQKNKKLRKAYLNAKKKVINYFNLNY